MKNKVLALGAFLLIAAGAAFSFSQSNATECCAQPAANATTECCAPQGGGSCCGLPCPLPCCE